MLRPFLEHRWGERPYERNASVETNSLMGLLWLWNNLHIVHHLHPTMPWYDIPGYYHFNKAGLMELKGTMSTGDTGIWRGGSWCGRISRQCIRRFDFRHRFTHCSVYRAPGLAIHASLG